MNKEVLLADAQVPIFATRYHDFSAGHRVCNHESKCAHLHGHNYRVTFHCQAFNTPTGQDSLGRVIDFSVIKATLCEWLEENWDHKFLVWEEDPFADQLRGMDPEGVVLVPFNPTAENMGLHLLNVVAPNQLSGTGVSVVEISVEETRKCAAIVKRPS